MIVELFSAIGSAIGKILVIKEQCFIDCFTVTGERNTECTVSFVTNRKCVAALIRCSTYNQAETVYFHIVVSNQCYFCHNRVVRNVLLPWIIWCEQRRR